MHYFACPEISKVLRVGPARRENILQFDTEKLEVNCAVYLVLRREFVKKSKFGLNH